MILYLTVGTNDLTRAGAFYDVVLGEMGHSRLYEAENELCYGTRSEDMRLWVVRPFDDRPATVGNGSMVALSAESRAVVDQCHAKGLAHGGTDEGAPGLRPYADNFYAAYLRDPDGNKLSIVCMAPG